MTADPRILIHALGGLSTTFRDWAFVTDTTAEEARWVASDMADASEETRTYCEVLKTEAQEASAKARRQAEEAGNAHSEAIDAASQLTASDGRTQTVRARAAQAHNLWRHNLAAARAELQAARAELADAQAALSRSLSHLQSAQHEYDSAVSDYNACRSSSWTDNQGRQRSYDCSSHAARVNSASRAVSEAQTHVNNAQIWVSRAQQRVTAAEREVAHCEERYALADACLQHVDALRPRLELGHRLAEEATANGRDGVERGNSAIVSATRSVELAGAALDAAHAAQDATNRSMASARKLKSIADVQIEQSSLGVHNLDATTDELSRFDDSRPIEG